jgi:hypothetical protein
MPLGKTTLTALSRTSYGTGVRGRYRLHYFIEY